MKRFLLSLILLIASVRIFAQGDHTPAQVTLNSQTYKACSSLQWEVPLVVLVFDESGTEIPSFSAMNGEYHMDWYSNSSTGSGEVTIVPRLRDLWVSDFSGGFPASGGIQEYDVRVRLYSTQGNELWSNLLHLRYEQPPPLPSQPEVRLKCYTCCTDCSSGGKEWNMGFEVVFFDGTQEISFNPSWTYMAYMRLLPSVQWENAPRDPYLLNRFGWDGHNGTGGSNFDRYETYATIQMPGGQTYTSAIVVVPFHCAACFFY